MKNGQIVEQGETKTCLKTQHPYTLKLINSSPNEKKFKSKIQNNFENKQS